MMRGIKTILTLLSVLIIFGIGLKSYAQPNIPKEKIPADISEDIRKEIERLYSSNNIEQGYAAVSLGKKGERATPAIPFLVAILGDNTDLFWSAFGSTGFRTTSPGFEAAKALSKIGKPAVEPLIEALKSDDDFVRINAAIALNWIGDPRAVEPLIVALKDKLWRVQWRAAAGLGKIKDPRSIEPLITALKDENSSVRESAALALGEIRDARAVEPLINALKDEEWRVRSNVVEALGKIKDPRAVEPLIAILKDTSPPVRKALAEALGKITNKDFGKDFENGKSGGSK